MKLIYRAKFQLIWINIVILTEICVYGNFSLPLAKVLAKDFFFLIFFCKIEFGKSRQFSGLPWLIEQLWKKKSDNVPPSPLSYQVGLSRFSSSVYHFFLQKTTSKPFIYMKREKFSKTVFWLFSPIIGPLVTSQPKTFYKF